MNRINIILMILLLTLVRELIAQQINYNDFKKQYALSCTNFNKTAVEKSFRLLDSLSQFEITEGTWLYNYDYGMTYYGKWVGSDNMEDLIKSIEYMEKSLAEKETSNILWNLAFNYSYKNCEKAHEYAERYVKVRKEEKFDVDYQQLYYLYMRCWQSK